MQKLVVSRHKALVDYLKERGYVDESVEVLSYARVEDVQGKHVFGILPYWLASRAEMLTEIMMRVPQDKRGVELTLDEIRFYATRARTYTVREVGSSDGREDPRLPEEGTDGGAGE